MKELLEALMNAKTKTEIEKAYRNLERVGMDRMTAKILVNKLKNETEV